MGINKRFFSLYFLAPFLIFAFAYLLRMIFFQGFVLGDDAMELPLIEDIMAYGPNWSDQLHLRFGVWFFNVLFFQYFGKSEMTFFLPTILMSCSFGVIGYFLLLKWRYQPVSSFFASLFVVSAPFEILIGTVRANDIILAWLLALALISFFYLKKRPLLQGGLLAFLFWFSFYVKLWAIYLLPALTIYYLIKIIKDREWTGAMSFFLFSLLFHAPTLIFFKIKLGHYLPFFTNHAATYPVPFRDLSWLFLKYPTFIFKGSEFGTTLFGFLPNLLISLLIIKLFFVVFFKGTNAGCRFDFEDASLIAYYGSFFLLLNFFPNSFRFDQYYSAPRIFRYLTPLSFPITLHAAKIILDLLNIKKWRVVFLSIVFFSCLIGLTVYQAKEATEPGRINRHNLLAVIEDVKRIHPPQIIVESWLHCFLSRIYLKDTPVKTIMYVYDAKDYEKWLNKNQAKWPEGSLLLTGLGQAVHYGGHHCGFRLKLFKNHLAPCWKLYQKYGLLSYLPVPENTCLWILRK